MICPVWLQVLWRVLWRWHGWVSHCRIWNREQFNQIAGLGDSAKMVDSILWVRLPNWSVRRFEAWTFSHIKESFPASRRTKCFLTFMCHVSCPTFLRCFSFAMGSYWRLSRRGILIMERCFQRERSRVVTCQRKTDSEIETATLTHGCVLIQCKYTAKWPCYLWENDDQPVKSWHYMMSL